MATTMSHHELEVLPELEMEFEDEGEGEFEDEAFLGGLLKGVGSALGLGEGEDEFEMEDEFEAEDEFEMEDEFEAEDEWEGELSPLRRIYQDAYLEMEHLGHIAAEAESEAEAGEAFLPLIPLALKALPMALKAGKAMRAVTKVAPKLMRGVRTIGRTMRRNPRMRPLARTMPTIARRTTLRLAKQAARGQAITPQTATRVLANETKRMVHNPQICAHTLRRARAADRTFHQATRARTIRPVSARCTCGPVCPTCGGVKSVRAVSR